MPLVQVEMRLTANPATAFDWFVEPQLLTRWWPSEAEIDAVAGGHYRMHWAGPDVTLRGEYTAVEPGARLAFTWSWDHDELPPRAVEITFAPSAGGTTVTVAHEADADDEATDYRDGWTHFLTRLAAAIATA